MSFVNNLPREKQIEVIAALCEGVGIRTAARLTGVNRGTVGNLALRVGLGCMELHDRIMVGIRTERCELDEAWSFVGKKANKRWVWIALARHSRQVVAYAIGDRSEQTCRRLWERIPERVCEKSS